MTRHAIVGITAMTLTLCAGSVVAQVRTDETRRQNQQQQQPQQDRNQYRTTQGQEQRAMTQRTNLRLHRAQDLLGSDLNGTDDNTVGSIRDFIVDRGSGEIVFAVVGAGGVMGMGGDQYAIPFEQLTWSENDDSFRTSMTEEQLKGRTPLPDGWDDLNDTGWMRSVTGWNGDRGGTYATDEAIAAATSEAETEEIRGRIVSIDRDSERFGSENVVVQIETEDGEQKEVVLGPSWYVSGHESAPLRGQTVVLKAKEYNGTWYGWSAGERGNELMLRNEDGSPAWRTERDGMDRNRMDRDRTDRERMDRTGSDRNTDTNRENRSGTDNRTGTDRGDSPTTSDSNRGTRPTDTTTDDARTTSTTGTRTTGTTGTRTGATENDSPTTRNSNVGTRSTNPAGESGSRSGQSGQQDSGRVENESPTTRNSNVGTRSTNPADATDSRRTTQPARTTDRDRQTDRQRQDRTRAGAHAGLQSSRYILLSDLVGAEATARGISSGEIQDVVIESGSGKACFLLFDANENFMGIGDDLTMVPWKVAYVSSDNTVNIDADASDFSNAMKAPENFEDVRSSTALASAYSAFNTRPDAMRERSMNQNDPNRMNERDRSGTNRMNERDRMNENDRTDRDNRSGQDRPRGTGGNP